MHWREMLLGAILIVFTTLEMLWKPSLVSHSMQITFVSTFELCIHNNSCERATAWYGMCCYFYFAFYLVKLKSRHKIVSFLLYIYCTRNYYCSGGFCWFGLGNKITIANQQMFPIDGYRLPSCVSYCEGDARSFVGVKGFQLSFELSLS